MPKKILIIDNDTGFNDLLADIFTQANYQVFTEKNPLLAIERFKEIPFDLVITDQNMKNMKGIDLVKTIKSIKPLTKIIMVSEFMEDSMMQEVTAIGVDSIFIKPINIFSLTKRTLELIKSCPVTSSTPEAKEQRITIAQIQSFPCISDASEQFAKKLIHAKDFKSLLVLEGGVGLPFVGICKDFENLFKDSKHEAFTYPSKKLENTQDLLESFKEKITPETKRLNLVILEASLFNPEIFNCNTDENTLESQGIHTRFIVCMPTDESTAFLKNYQGNDRQTIRIPSLNDCKDDIPQLAQSIFNDITNLTGMDVIEGCFSVECLNYLKEQSWVHNNKQLKGVILTALSLADQTKRLELSHFKEAFKAYILREVLGPQNQLLTQKLDDFKEDYIKATYRLLQSDRDLTLRTLKINDVMLTAALGQH